MQNQITENLRHTHVFSVHCTGGVWPVEGAISCEVAVGTGCAALVSRIFQVRPEIPDYSGNMEPPEIEKLHKKCVERLKDLIAQANRTCSLLDSMAEFPLSLNVWQEAVEQRVRENDAHRRYQEARARLFDAIRPQQ